MYRGNISINRIAAGLSSVINYTSEAACRLFTTMQQKYAIIIDTRLFK